MLQIGRRLASARASLPRVTLFWPPRPDIAAEALRKDDSHQARDARAPNDVVKLHAGAVQREADSTDESFLPNVDEGLPGVSASTTCYGAKVQPMHAAKIGVAFSRG
jgi:hypothetical protein